jgi:hypothetical protein
MLKHLKFEICKKLASFGKKLAIVRKYVFMVVRDSCKHRNRTKQGIRTALNSNDQKGYMATCT